MHQQNALWMKTEPKHAVGFLADRNGCRSKRFTGLFGGHNRLPQLQKRWATLLTA